MTNTVHREASPQTSRQGGYMLFVPQDFRDMEGLVNKLCSHTDPISNRLWDRLPLETQKIIRESKPDSPAVQACVINALNDFLYSDTLYSRDEFPDEILSKETRRLIKCDPRGAALLEFNRRLLEDAYSLEIEKMRSGSPNANPTVFLEILFKLFPIAALLIYATGFLVEAVFLDRFGIIEANIEFLKINYVQTGLLFLAFPAFVLAPIFIYYKMRNDPHVTTRMPSIAIIGMVNLLFTFYWFATFGPPGDFYAKRYPIAGLFVWTMVLIASGRRIAVAETSDVQWIDKAVALIVDPLFKKSVDKTLDEAVRRRALKLRANLVRMLFGLAIMAFAIYILESVGMILSLATLGICFLTWLSRRRNPRSQGLRFLVRSLAGLAILTGIGLVMEWRNCDWDRVCHVAVYYFYCGLLLGFLWKEIKSIRIRYSKRERPLVWSLRMCVIVALYYMGVLAFAYGIYPNIPAAKGGGNYAHAPDVVLYFNPATMPSLPGNIVDTTATGRLSWLGMGGGKMIKSCRVKIIYATPTCIYVANPRDPQTTDGVKRWSEWKIPEVIALKRDTILSIVHFQDNYHSGPHANGLPATPQAAPQAKPQPTPQPASPQTTPPCQSQPQGQGSPNKANALP